MATNFSKYIDSVIVNPPSDFKGYYGFQCKNSVDAISNHLGYDIQDGNAWDLYKRGIKGYHQERIGAYCPLPGDIVFMSPSKANGGFGHMCTADEGCTVSTYKIIEQNYGIQEASGSGIGDRHIQRRTRDAKKFGGILARNEAFIIKQVLYG